MGCCKGFGLRVLVACSFTASGRLPLQGYPKGLALNAVGALGVEGFGLNA